MDFDQTEFSLLFNHKKFLLFNSDLEFSNLEDLLDHYEEGVRGRTYQFPYVELYCHYFESGFLGLLFRQNPMDLLRVLLAHGGEVLRANKRCSYRSAEIRPVTYVIADLKGNRIPLGQFYFDMDSDEDDQFPVFSKYLCFDLDLLEESFKETILTKLQEGFHLVAIVDGIHRTLVRKNEVIERVLGREASIKWLGYEFVPKY
ncbi:MAG: hypothetical protein CL676_09795 [Bdellovibrionaceae bacterium]|nr:hypothetical protein [Pseudobdellovibrionaceae bacterium]|tara:strand:+ start:5777 stop:6382 length:606 start_codon:yes stop_codon:yes gene_type:complete